MRVRADVAELLRAGLPDRVIARQLQVNWQTIRKSRAALGLPKNKGGRRAPDSHEDSFWNRTQPTDDGHILWAGALNTSGQPTLSYRGKILAPRRVAFEIRFRRTPEGYVTSTCDRDLCVSPHHVEDRAIRQRTDSTFAAIFGDVA